MEEKEETNIKPKIEYHYTYQLNMNNNNHVLITFICINKPNIEKVNKLLMNIMKSIHKLTFINDCHDMETMSQRYEQIIKNSIHYTSFKHLFEVRYVGQVEGFHLIRVC